jgi:hypothetical protein
MILFGVIFIIPSMVWNGSGTAEINPKEHCMQNLSECHVDVKIGTERDHVELK